MPRFVNRELNDMKDGTNQYVDCLQEVLYAQFQRAFMLVRSSNFRGVGADAFKAYIEEVSIHFLNRIIELTGELKEATPLIVGPFFAFF